jgi:hypothetical protein
MRARPVSTVLLTMVSGAAWACGCQLLYDKHELTVGTVGGGATTTSMTSTGGTGGTTSSGGGTGGTTSNGGGGTGGTTASGGGGTGGTTMTATGGGGTGGTTLTASGGGGTGGTTTTTGPDCSGERLFLLGTSANGVLCATYAPAGGWTASVDAAGSSNERPAVTMLDAQTGVGVFFQGAAPGPLRAIELANGTCGAAVDGPLKPDMTVAVTKAAPSAALLGGKAQVLFQGAEGVGTNHPFVAAWDPAAKWAMPAQVDTNVFSEASAGLAASGTEMLAVYGGGDDNLYRVRFSAGAWQLPAVSFKDALLAPEQTNKAVTPGVTGLAGGEWLVVFQEKLDPTQLRWLKGDGAVSLPSAKIATALSSYPVSLATLAGGAVLAYRGTNNGVYATVYDAANGAWGAIERIGGTTITTPASPAVAAGVCTHQAEVVYIDAADSVVKHAFLEAGVWSAPASVGGSATKGVAITRSP